MLHSALEEALEAWRDAREGVIEEVRNIPEDRLSFRPAEGVRSVAELVRHILEVSLMMVGELSQEKTDLTRKPFPALIREHDIGVESLETKPQLIEALEVTLTEGEARFRECGEEHMLQSMIRFDGQPGTRLAWLHHGISQEMYHRGQLALYERLMGIEPALTRKIRGK